MTITLHEFVNREIIHCASTLISDLLKLTAEAPQRVLRDVGTDYDELLDLCRREDWEEPVDWHIDNEMSREALIEALEARDFMDVGDDVPDGDLREKLKQALGEEEDGYRDFAQEHDIEPHEIESYEFWICTDWLAERLKEEGHAVGEICGLTIWGRPTTGQAISMDGVIQKIYCDLTGQKVTSADY